MTCNVGGVDRILRAVIGVAILGWGIAAKNWWGAIGLLPLATAVAGYCAAYAPFKFSTAKGK